MDRATWVQELLDKISIEDMFTGDGHQINTSGFVSCPFHKETKASCKIYDGSFYCFSCGVGGTALDYIIHRDNISFIEGFKVLAGMYNHPMPDMDPAEVVKMQAKQAESDKVYEMVKAICTEYHELMTEAERDYLHDRGLSDATIDKELIGYAGDGNTLLAAYENGSVEDLKKTGLFFVNDSGLAEIYQRRYIFPYWQNGKIVYTIGRLNTNDPREIQRLPSWNQNKYYKQLTKTDKRPYVSESVQNVIWNADGARKFKTGVIAEGIVDGLLFKQEVTPRYDIGVISPATVQFRTKDYDNLANICTHWQTTYLIPDNEVNQAGMEGAQKTASNLFEKGVTYISIATLPRGDEEKVDLADVINGKDKDLSAKSVKTALVTAVDYLFMRIQQIKELSPVEIDSQIPEIINMLSQVPESSYSFQMYVDALTKKQNGCTALISKKQLDNMLRSTQKEQSGDDRVEEGGIVDAFISMFECDGKNGLVYYKEDWYSWDNTHYKIMATPDLRGRLANFVKHGTTAETSVGLISNSLEELQGDCIVMSDVERPAWVENRLGAQHAGHFVSFENGFLNLGKLIDGEDVSLTPHSPDLFITYTLPFAFNPEAQSPKWNEFLDYCLHGDKELINVLQEFVGYCLVRDYRFHRFLMIEGQANTGKSTFTKVFTALLGEENVSHVPLEMFSERFGLTPTLGKLANIVSEVGELDTIAEAKLKMYTAGDPLTFDRKFKDAINQVPTARLVLATNTRPRLPDKSDGIWRRLILIPFRRKVTPDMEILHFDKILISEELAGVFMWALEGLHRLFTNGKFTESKTIAEEVAEYKEENNPAKVFLSENFVAEADGNCDSSDMYMEYQEWCKANGYNALNSINFGKEIKRVFPNVKRRKVKRDGISRWFRDGISHQ
jgi:putative DNA primase/helicase